MFTQHVQNMMMLGEKSLAAKVASILRKYGTDAHVYLPGIGVINGLTAGNYLDGAGTTPATVDNPVGLVLDATNTIGTNIITNGDFSGGATGWTLTGGWLISGGTASNSGSVGALEQTTGTLTVGKWYLIEYTAADTLIMNVVLGNNYITAANVSGLNRRYGQCTGNTKFALQGSGAYSGIDNISVKEVTGIHATQATTANKPILRRGAVNLLQRSQVFNLFWSITPPSTINPFGSGSTADAAIAPDGTLTADKITPANASAPSINQGYTGSVASSTFTASIYVKAAGAGFATLQINGQGGTVVASFVSIDLSNGTLGTIQVLAGGGLTSASATSTPAANGFYRVTLSGTLGATNTSVFVYIGMSDAQNTRTATVSTVNGIYIWGAQLEVGSTASTYIPTTTAPASNLAAGKYSWQFDGTDYLSLGSVPFQMADDHCVIVGANSTAAVASVIAIANNTTPAPYIARIRHSTVNTIVVDWRDDATVSIAHSVALTDGVTGVITARNISGTKIARKNGVQFGTSSTSQGATTVNTATIGALISSAPNYFTGSLYPVIFIKGTVSDGDCLLLERFVGLMSGVSF